MKLNKKKIGKFLRDNKWVFFQMGCMVLPAAIGYANDASNVQIDALKTPMSVLQNTMTQTVPRVGVSIAAAGGALSWAMGTENQIVKYALRTSIGGGLAMMAPATISNLTGSNVTGCLF